MRRVDPDGALLVMPYDCFISYTTADLEVAERIDARLRRAGFTVWFDKARLAPGSDWYRDIEAACENSRVILPVLTPRWRLSDWTKFETYGAESVIPLVVGGAFADVATPPLLRCQHQAVPAGTTTEAEWESLFSSLRALIAQPPPNKSERCAYLRYRSNPYFVGRENTLNEIHEKLFTNPTTALTQGHVEAITALGGVGKTTLARQYAEKFWRSYPQMFWVDCRRALESEFGSLHDHLFPTPGPFHDHRTPADVARCVRDELNKPGGPRRLLVLDDAEDEESLATWIPTTGSCHTVITSRFTAWSPGIGTCSVWVLEAGPARDLLLRRASRANDNSEVAACDALAKRLQYLPLALEQAAAYVAEQGPGYHFADYLRVYAEHERRLLEDRRPGATEYPNSVFVTWQATVAKLPEGSRAILRLCSVLAPAPIPSGALIAGALLIGGEADIDGVTEFEVRAWKATLARYSMIQLQPDDTLSVHALVQAVERHHARERLPALVDRATELVMSWAPTEMGVPASWDAWKVLLPHARQLRSWERSGTYGQVRQRLTETYRQFLKVYGAYVFRQDLPEAESLLREHLEVAERDLGGDHWETLNAVHALADLLWAGGSPVIAEQVCSQHVLKVESNGGSEGVTEARRLRAPAVWLYAKSRCCAPLVSGGSRLHGVNVSPYFAGESPEHTVPSRDQLHQRLSMIAPYVAWIRTFISGNGLDASGPVAHRLGLKAAAGAWISRDSAANDREIESVQELVSRGDADMVVVGHEALLRGDVAESQLLDYIHRVRSSVPPGVPVAASDEVWTLLSRPSVIRAVDVVMVSIHPFFEGHSAADAIHRLALAYGKAVAVADGTPVVIAETGWPSFGSKMGRAVPSPANAADFLLRFVSWARSSNVSYFYSEAFDQEWRSLNEPTGASWGLWDSRGGMKPEVRAVFSGTSVGRPA